MLLDISNSIEPAFAAVLADLSELTNGSDIEFLVVGAMARDMVLDCGFGIAAGRATRDIDFGIRVTDWETFGRLVQLLKDNNWHCPEKQQHRFVHEETGIPVDLIPFGAIESDGSEIRWPPHFNEALSVLGFSDAYADSWRAQIRQAPALEVHVASPAGQALLKLAAWHDRGIIRGGRDADDLRLLMERYLDLGHMERVAEEHLEWLDDEFDYPLVGAKLLGIDVNRCANNMPSEQLRALIDAVDHDQPERTLAFAMHSIGDDDDLLHCQNLVAAFCSTTQ